MVGFMVPFAIHRQRESESASLAPNALHGHFSSKEIGQPATDRQPQTCSFVFSGHPGIDLPKRLEQLRQIRGLDSDARVSHTKLDGGPWRSRLLTSKIRDYLGDENDFAPLCE